MYAPMCLCVYGYVCMYIHVCVYAHVCTFRSIIHSGWSQSSFCMSQYYVNVVYTKCLTVSSASSVTYACTSKYCLYVQAVTADELN